MNEISPWRIQRVNEPAFAEHVYTPQMEEAHLRDYWKIVVKYRRLIVTIFLGVFVSGAYLISRATPMYTASATIKIDPQNPQFTRIEEVLSLQVQSGDYYPTQHELMKSRALAAKVITELGLESNRAFTSGRIVSPDPVKWLSAKFFGIVQAIINSISSLSKSSQPQSPQPTNINQQTALTENEASPLPKQDRKPDVGPGNIDRYLGFLKIEPMKGTRLVKILFNTPDPNLSQQLANAHAAAFVRMNLETRFDVTKEARKFLEKKLAELRSKVEESEAELSEFRKAHGVVSMDRGENLIVDRMITLNSSLTSARIKRIELESLRQMLKNKNADDLSEVMTNGTIQNYRTAIESLTADQVKLATVLKPDHPRMIELSTRLNDTRQRMKAAIAEVVHRIETDYESARNREASLEAEASRQKQAAIDLKGLGVKYSVIQSEAESNRTLYNGLLARLNETTISNDLPVSNMQISELADTPGWLSSGAQQLKLLLATMGGALFLAVGLAFCLAYFDSTVSNPDEVWSFLFVPTLGIVPELRSLRHEPHGYFQFSKDSFRRVITHLRARRSDSSKGLISPSPSSILSESYRSIRTALLFSQPETPPKIVLFTSPGPGEGKTVTTLNLAIALAQSGKNVLLIDADMRKGRCHQLLHRPNKKGLSNFLTGNSRLDESLQDTAVPGLSLLTRGPVPPNPSDLLGSSKMKEFLDVVRNRFEFVLLDTSPVIGVTDSEVLSASCDGVVLVLHGQKTNKFSARQALQTLETVRAHVLGVVLNGIDLRNPDYASYRYYYNSYYATVNPETENQQAEQLVKNRPESTYASVNAEPENQQAEQLVENRRESTAKDEPASPPVEPMGNVPQQFIDHLISKFSEAAGAMAPVIIRDHVELMGESMNAFPKKRLNELIDRVCEEVLNESLRNNFKKSMLQETFR